MASSSINTVSSGAKNYVSGLASGMDTESMVESLLAGTQSKIDKQTGARQQLEWKQDIYRSMITNINTFGDKYFSYFGSGDTNLLSSSLYNTMTGISSSGAVKVNSVATNAVSGLNIDSIQQLATACTVKTAEAVTGKAVAKEADLSKFDDSSKTYSFSITLDGVSKTISFQGDTDGSKVLKNINQALYRNFGTSVGMDLDGNKMELVQLDSTGNPTGVSVDSSRRVIIQSVAGQEDTAKYLGFEGGFSNKLAYGMALKDMNFATPLQGGRYEFEINGVTVKGLTGDSTLSEVISAINGSGAGVTVSYSSAADKFIMQSSTTGEISNITMKQTYGNLLTTMFGVEAAGAQSGLFSKDIETSNTAGAPDGLAGLDAVKAFLFNGEDVKFTFRVDDEDVTITLTGKKESSLYKTRQNVVDAFNAQFDKKFGTGKIALSLSEDSGDATKSKLVLSSKEHKIEFPAGASDSAATLGFTNADPTKNVTNLLKPEDDLADMGLSGILTIGGNTFDTANPTTAYPATVEGLMKFLEDGLGGSANVKFDNGRINIVDLNGKNISGTIADSLFGTNNLGFTSVSNSVTSESLAAVPNSGKVTVNVNGNLTEIDFGNSPGGDPMDALLNAIRGAGNGITANYTNGRLEISGGDTEFSLNGADDAGKDIIRSLFQSESFVYNPKMTANVTAGQNAKLTIDGVVVERNTNTFEIDGITMELTSTSNDPISLTTSRDTDKIVDSLKGFVEDYNKLIEELNGYLKEDSSYKKYPPLTDAQKKEMSDKEIELWEKKSKTGLLRNDQNVSNFLSDMRMILYNKVESAGLALYDIGIETSDKWQDNGKLVIDEDRLQSAIATNVDNISKLFTDKEQGVAVKLQQAIKDAANVSSGSPGAMVRYAGTKDVLVAKNTLYEQMKSITQTLSNLNNKYTLEKARYWKQFTAMEQAISNMNSQSSWLTQQFSA